MMASLPGRTTPEGSSDSLYVTPSITSVWPALWPPWKRTTTSARAESQSTILPLPSSPHWAPITATLDIIPYPDHWPRAGIASGTVTTYSGEARPLSGGFRAKRNEHWHTLPIRVVGGGAQLSTQELLFEAGFHPDADCNDDS